MNAGLLDQLPALAALAEAKADAAREAGNHALAYDLFRVVEYTDALIVALADCRRAIEPPQPELILYPQEDNDD